MISKIKLPTHRAAFAAFFTADFFLGRYAANYYAKELLPRTTCRLLLEAPAALERDRICLYCWMHDNKLAEENENHMFFHCPMNQEARCMFKERVSTLTLNKVQQAGNSVQDVCSVLSTATCADLETIGYFLYRVRQARRRFKEHCSSLRDSLKREAFGVRKAAWRTKGQHVCRHGMFYVSRPADGCQCILGDFGNAMYMPMVSTDLKQLVAVPFKNGSAKRLGQLQAELRRRQW